MRAVYNLTSADYLPRRRSFRLRKATQGGVGGLARVEDGVRYVKGGGSGDFTGSILFRTSAVVDWAAVKRRATRDRLRTD